MLFSALSRDKYISGDIVLFRTKCRSVFEKIRPNEKDPMKKMKTDSRVHRTEVALHRSLASLIHEKSYDSIVVKEILARANVARSTFYAHFDSKEALLLDSIRNLLDAARSELPESSNPVERLLYFSLPLLRHIETHLEQTCVDGRPRDQSQVHRRLGEVLVEHVEAEVRRTRVHRDNPGMPSELLAKYVAVTFLSVLEWWLPRMRSHSACDANAWYRTLVQPALEKRLARD